MDSMITTSTRERKGQSKTTSSCSASKKEVINICCSGPDNEVIDLSYDSNHKGIEVTDHSSIVDNNGADELKINVVPVVQGPKKLKDDDTVAATAVIVTPRSSKKRKLELKTSSDGKGDNESDLQQSILNPDLYKSSNKIKKESKEEGATSDCLCKAEGKVNNFQSDDEQDIPLATNPQQVRSSPDQVKKEDEGAANVSTVNATESLGEHVTHSSSTEVKKEEAEEKLNAARNEAYEKYADLPLLHRFNGIGLLGGAFQNSYPVPTNKCKKVFDGDKIREGYPIPKHCTTKNENGDDEYDMNDFAYVAFDTLWHTNGPKFAGQPTAAVNELAGLFKKKNVVFPLFMKRSLTKPSHKREQRVLGWEYVGNYRCISDQDLELWESAKNVHEANKHKIKECMLRSAARSAGYGRCRIDRWKEHLDNEIEKHRKNAREGKVVIPNSIGARAIKLNYRHNMTDSALMDVVVELDEFYEEEIIEFVEYDERIYEFCSKGLTTKNSNGEVRKNKGGAHATARDWYDFATENMLMN